MVYNMHESVLGTVSTFPSFRQLWGEVMLVKTSLPLLESRMNISVSILLFLHTEYEQG